MRCPNCRLEQPDTSETCEGCGLIFAKWRERNPPPVPAASAETPSSEEPAAEPPPPPESAPWPRPLPEREYKEFPVKKFLLIGIPLLLGGALYALWPSAKTDGYATPKPIPLPTSIYGNATEQPVYPTETPWPCGYPEATCTPTRIATPMTISGPAWQYHGKVQDCVHLSPVAGAAIVFHNNGVAVTAVTNDQGFYHLSVPPLSGSETYEARLSHPNFGDRYWTDDPSGLDVNARLAKYYEDPGTQHFRMSGAEDKVVDFSMFPYQLSEQEHMQLQNARPPSQP